MSCKCPLLPDFVLSKLMFVPVAGALIGSHRDCLLRASIASQTDIIFVCQGQSFLLISHYYT